MPIILAGDFNVNVKDNYNAKLVEFMKDTFELDVVSDFSQGTTRSNSCIDMVFGPILSRTNHQAPQLTHVTTN
jgi:hypothetical protein